MQDHSGVSMASLRGESRRRVRTLTGEEQRSSTSYAAVEDLEHKVMLQQCYLVFSCQTFYRISPKSQIVSPACRMAEGSLNLTALSGDNRIAA